MEQTKSKRFMYWLSTIYFSLYFLFMLLYTLEKPFGIMNFLEKPGNEFLSYVLDYGFIAVMLEGIAIICVYYLVMLLLNYFKGAAIKEFIVPVAGFLALFSFELFYSRQAWVFGPIYLMFLPMIIAIFIVVYSVLMIKGKIGLNSTISVKEPWKSVILFGFLSLIIEVFSLFYYYYNLYSSDLLDGPRMLVQMLNFPGEHISDSLQLCSYANYAGHVPLTFCLGFFILVLNILFWVIIGLIIGFIRLKIQKHAQK